MKALCLIVGALSVIAACDHEPAAPPITARQVSGHGSGITVMSRNMYVGGNVDPIIAATDPTQVPFLVAAAFQELMATKYAVRAQLMADEIALTRPHLVGLQEVSLIRIQSPGDLVVGGTSPAETVVLDFLPVLLDALADRGLDYQVVAQIENTDVEVPMITSATPTFDDVRLTDYDALLARGDVRTSSVVEQNFVQTLPVPGTPIEVRRGFVAVDARVNGVTYRVVSTHLESAVEVVQQLQAAELVQYLASETRPVIALGDFNSDAETGGTTYQLLLGAGYSDAWRSRDGGPTQALTCCHASDLSNTTAALRSRIDLVLTRNMRSTAVLADVVGDDPVERREGVWASDHAGVVVRFPGRP